MIKKKYTVKSDPNGQEEAKKYENPIPSRMVIDEYLKDTDFPVTIENIADALDLYKPDQIKALFFRLSAMVRDNEIDHNQVYYQQKNKKEILAKGKVAFNQDGNATIYSDHYQQQAYILARHARALFHGDEVTVKITGLNKKNKLEAIIVSINKRNTFEVVGRYYKEFDCSYIKPVNKMMQQNIAMLPTKQNLKTDDLIKAKILMQPSLNTLAVAKFIESVQEQSPIFEAISMASKKHNLPEDWKKETLKELESIPEQIKPEDLKNRTDLRALPFVTIDGEDAKDFDDAIYVEKSKTGGWKLYVAIADVSYYVRPDSPLDNEARERSTSVYFPGFVIPMIPEKISNGLCSLQPDVNRLALVCEMNISKSGQLSRWKFYSAAINSKARLTYTEVTKLLNNEKNVITDKYSHLSKDLFIAHDLYKGLLNKRKERGAIDFDTVETKIILNSERHIEAIVPTHRNDAHRLIEEFMLLANVATAKFLTKNKQPIPYRVHQKPFMEKINDLKSYLSIHNVEFKIKGDEVEPADISNMLNSAKDHDDYDNIQLMTLKSMNQAVYATENMGHFGLAYAAYTHFTSPIRRYPDLIVHRSIKNVIDEISLGGKDYSTNNLNIVCEHASTQERNADSASKEVENWLKCHYIKDKVGEVLTAKITHIANFGMFTELKDIYVEGLIHISSLEGDYYIFDENKHQLIGKNSKKVYEIGQELEIRIARVDMENGHIDFELSSNTKSYPRPNKKHKTKRRTRKGDQDSIDSKVKKISESLKMKNDKSKAKKFKNKAKAKKAIEVKK